MFAHIRVRLAGHDWRDAPATFASFALRAAVFLSLAALPACTGAPTPPLAGDPSDSSARVAPARYQSALGAYEGQRPVAPSPWREQNERVSPQPKGNNP